MNLLSILLLIIYSMIILGLIWAKYRFFPIKTKTSRISSYFYDPIVAIHIITTYYLFLTTNNIHLIRGLLAATLYISGIGIFCWAMVSAKHLDYAFGNKILQIVTSGPFAIVRHPLYLSYTIVWLTSTILFNSLYLWITLTYLVSFYLASAKSEEKALIKSEYSREYLEYSQKVGMFLPRIAKWKK